MKATLREDIIMAVGRGDTEIGCMPPGVGIERLRWDGERLVDLAEVLTIHVRHLSGSHFELHAVPVTHSQPVTMSWADRKRLTVTDGVIRLKTETETEAEVKTGKASAIRARYAALLAGVAGPYLREERETWFTQLKEADEWLADPAVGTPMLTAMATGRGITVATLVAKVKANDQLLGEQQRELDEL